MVAVLKKKTKNFMNEFASGSNVNSYSCSPIAIHNWAGNVNHGLPLDVGDFVEICEENGPWLRGTTTCSRKQRSIGIFPKSYVHIKDLSKEDPVVAECTQGINF